MRLRSILVVLVCLAAASEAAGQTSGTDRFQAAIGLARVKRDAGDFVTARRYFEDARRIREFAPSELAEYFWVLAGQDSAAALATGRAVLVKNPEKRDVRDRSITEALTLGNESAVVELARAGRAVDPNTALWPRRMAESLSRQKLHSAAADAYGEAVSSPDATAQDRVALAVTLEAAARYAEAVEAWAAAPAAARQGHVDLEHSRLRSLALSSNPAAGPELDAWLAASPADAEMRALAADVWTRAGNPARALAVMGPLSGQSWIRRRVAAARAAGKPAAAIAALDELGPRAWTREDRFTLAELLIDDRQFKRAETTLASLAKPGTCDPKLMGFVDRLPEPAGTAQYLKLLASPACDGKASLLRRGIELNVASSQHKAALDLIARLPREAASAPDMQRLAGLLLLWTGQPASASPRLEAALQANGQDVEVREALVDAYRLQNRLGAAWSTAEPLVASPILSQKRRLILADLALDVNRPAAALSLLRAGGGDPETRTRLLARASLSELRVAERDYVAHPSDAGVSRVLELQEACGGNTEAALIAGRVLAHAGRDEQALAVLPVTADEPAMLKEIGQLRSTLWTRVARAAWSAGAHDKAAAAAQKAVDADPRAVESWFVLIDHAADSSGGVSVKDVAARFAVAVEHDPSLVISMAERMSAFVRSHDDPVVEAAAKLLDGLAPADPRQSSAVHVAKARVLSAAERWPESLAAADAAVAADRTNPAALKLRAEILSWAGRHMEAVDAYGTYLAAEPADLEARRQQARVAGWSGDYASARMYYRRLATEAPDDKGVAAEVTAKLAYFDGRWSAAVAAYRTWIALEPRNGEARFELAESLRAAGRAHDADVALTALASSDRHRLAQAALDREGTLRKPSIALTADDRRSDGYDGQRLLNLRHYGLAWTGTMDSTSRFTLKLSAAGVEASDGHHLRRGYEAGLEFGSRLTRFLELTTRTTASTVGPTDATTAEGAFLTAWKMSDRWSASAGVDRSRIAENIGTIDTRLVATGIVAGAHFESPHTTFDLQTSAARLTDDNVRTRSSLTVTRTLSDRFDNVRLIGWAESLSYRFADAGYFSPSGFLRADAGLQFTQPFFTPRFRNDRQQFIQISYLIGGDDRGTIYHHPSVVASWQFSSGLAFDARAHWIRSTVYNETSIYAGLTARPGGPRK